MKKLLLHGNIKLSAYSLIEKPTKNKEFSRINYFKLKKIYFTKKLLQNKVIYDNINIYIGGNYEQKTTRKN